MILISLNCWIPFRQVSLGFTDTSIHPIYGLHEDTVTSVLCLCWKGAEVLLVSVPKAYLESAQEVVHLLPWKSQHKHKGIQTHPSPPSKVIFPLQEPYKVQVQQALSAEAVRLPMASQPKGFSTWFSTSCNTTVSKSLLLGTRPVFADLTAGLILWFCFPWGVLTYRCCLEQITDTSHFFCQQQDIGCPPCSQI